jgi:hypothetical protein
MAKKHNKIFHSKAFQNISKLGFLVCKYAIWQPWLVIQEQVTSIGRHSTFQSDESLLQHFVKHVMKAPTTSFLLSKLARATKERTRHPPPTHKFGNDCQQKWN